MAKSQAAIRTFWSGNKGCPIENATEFTGTLVNGTTAVATVQVGFKWYEEDGY